VSNTGFSFVIVEGQGIRFGLSAAFACSFDDLLAFPAIAAAALALTVKVYVMNFVAYSIVPTEIDVFHSVKHWRFLSYCSHSILPWV
jgi:hypothetical protein